MIYGAILAGGIGKRIENHSIPKQFIAIGGTPIIILTVREFINNKRFENIYIAIHREWEDYLRSLLSNYFSMEERKKIVIVKGGKERIDSFINVMEDIIEKKGLNETDILVCHDSVRPFVCQQMINDCIDATIENGIALTVVPAIDTIHVGHDEKYIDGTLDRNGLYNGQTPSGFNIKLLFEVINNCTDEEKAKVTGTTQLMLQKGYKIRIVKGHTSNFKITTNNDLDIADRIIRSSTKKRNIYLLDCTLRDGGIVIDFKFGVDRIQTIKKTLEKSGVNYIECGYIDEKKGGAIGLTCYDNEVSIEKTFLSSGKKHNISYVAMIDYGNFNVNNLFKRTDKSIDGIRLAFHKENWESAIESGKIIIEKGYDLYIQPMVSLRYTDDEYRKLIQTCNEKLERAKGFYIVDSFGQMDSSSLLHMLEIADQYLSINMKIGFHAHNNRQMAYSNALTFIKHNAKHDIMLDASIMGMGKGAGNLCTELIEDDLIKEGNLYDTHVIYEIISEYFGEQQKMTHWGYSLEYYLSSLYSVTPSYIKIFTSDERVTTNDLIKLISTIPDEKKTACDKAFADEHLKQYFAYI